MWLGASCEVLYFVPDLMSALIYSIVLYHKVSLVNGDKNQSNVSWSKFCIYKPLHYNAQGCRKQATTDFAAV